VAKYIVAPIVHSELREIWFFIAEDNPEAATQVVDAAERTFELLAQNPGLGHLRSFRQNAYRNLRVRPVDGFVKYLVL
jgi:plasmid stabilization system protein ParE